MDERWCPVVGYEGWYEVSDFGRVRRVRAATGAKVGRVLRPRPDKEGRMYVFLSRRCRVRTVSVHSLVAAAFLGPRPVGWDTHHLDTNPSNNLLTNLRYLPEPEHMRTIRRPHGDRHYAARLSIADVETIRHIHPDPFSTVGATVTARLLGVSRGAVTGVITGKNRKAG